MVEARPDWCISRQRAWGIPIPLFIHKNTGDLHPDTLNLLEKVALRIEKQGIDAWYRSGSQKNLLGTDAEKIIEKSSDILDVWFDSGVSACLCSRDNVLNYGIPLIYI